MSNTMHPAVESANARILAPLRERVAQYYTLASEAIRVAGGVSALVALTSCPAAARARMVQAARDFYRATRAHRDAHRATDGLIDAMRAWGLEVEATQLAAHKARS